ncbi:MAG: cytochrome c-type biogenesis protein [Pseudomonadota bacterium]
MKRLLLILLLCATPLLAVEPDEVLDDPELEERARAISAEVRCVVCQNEPIDSSNAGVARDLRLIIRERLVAGDTDAEVFEYLVLRYGDFVLFNPPWKPSTYALWLGPFVILFMGFLAVVMALNKQRKAVATDLTPEEQAKLNEMRKEKS